MLAAVLLIGAVVGGTIAWLFDTTDTVTNTFSIGDVSISLTETAGDPKEDGSRSFTNFVPGADLPKDPKVTITDGSEKCHVFVKVEEINNTNASLGENKIIKWTQADGWEVYSPSGAATNVTYLYRVVEKDANPKTFSVISGDSVHVNDDITKEMADGEEGIRTKIPNLKFTAGAVQFDNRTKDQAFGALNF